MGKKITSSSPLDTIAFDAIPTVTPYSREQKIHTVNQITQDYSSGDGGYYTSTATNTDLTGDEKPCPPGKHVDPNGGGCIKNKKTSRGSRLKKGIAEDEALGKTASAARKRKRLAGWQLGQEKRTKQIDESGKTFFGRLGSNIGDIFDPNAHKGTFNTKGKPEKYDKSRHDLKLERVKNIKKEEGKVAHQAKIDACESAQDKKWENGACVDLVTTNFNRISTSSTNLSSITTGLIGTGIKKQSQKTCPPGQTYNKALKTCI